MNKHVTKLAISCLLVLPAVSHGEGETTTPQTEAQSGSTNAMQLQSLPSEAAASGRDTHAVKMGFKRLDSDDDGYISQTEAQPQDELTAHFDSVDNNGDKRLDEAEFAKFAQTQSKSILNSDQGPKDDLKGSAENTQPEASIHKRPPEGTVQV